MASTILLEFEDPQMVRSLFVEDETLLRLAEKKLLVKIITRDGWIKIQGERESQQRAAQLFEELAQQLRSGKEIFQQDFVQILENQLPKPSSAAKSKIFCSARKPPILAKTKAQESYLSTIDQHAITLGIGPAGTGKTYLAIAKALEALKKDRVTTIVLTRPAVEAGEALGFLPGQLQEKLLPYLRPLYDALYNMLATEEVERLLDKEIIQIAPLAYMRGRTLNRSFIILDEAQNTTCEQMLMFLTRVGLGSQAVITGDPSQIDLPRNKPSGLIEAIGILKTIPQIGAHHFCQSDIVRHPLVQLIIEAYQKERHERTS